MVGTGSARYALAAAALCLITAGCTSTSSGSAGPVSPAGAAAGARRPPAAVTRIVDRIAARAVRAGVGLSVAVESHGQLYARGYGLAGVRPDRLVTPATVFPVASLTKQFTAAAIMQLVERHRLRLQDTVGGLLPGIRWADPRARRVTVRELLTHTSGIPGYTSVPAFARLESQPQSSRTILRLVSGLPLKFAPGTGAAYSNTGYYLLGLIIQRVTGLPYGQYLQQRLLAGLGLTHTGLCPEPATGDEASLYRTGGRSPAAAPRISLVNAYAAGELCSTATDLLRWQAALRSGRVVALAAYRQMVTPLRLADGRTIAYGFGLDLDPIDGHPAVSHEGGFPGATSELVWFPHDDLAIAVLSNSSAVAAWDLSAQIAAPLLRNNRTAGARRSD